MTARIVKNATTNAVISTETFTYDAAGNITDAPESCFAYDTNNRLTVFCGQNVSYDSDGNMLSCGSLSCTYDSANRLITAGGHNYTYNAEDVRIRNLCADANTTYTYDTNCKLSKLLCKTTNGITTKYVYGRGLIGEEKCGEFKTYHFDKRGSTVALTDVNGNITDTFKYDTYGKLIERTGESFIIFGYNGRDGVVTDKNGLIYMRARYYSPEMKRFVNADIVRGAITNAVTLNRYAYANANPVSNVDPFVLLAIVLKPTNETSAMMFDGGGGGGTIVTPKPSTTTSAAQSPTATAPATPITPTAPSHSEYATIRDGGGTSSASNATPPPSSNNTCNRSPSNDAYNFVNQIQSVNQQQQDLNNQILSEQLSILENTFGAGVIQSQDYKAMEFDTLFYGFETGASTTLVTVGDISKPISVYVKNASDWWKFWEYKVGVQFNIGDGGFSLDTNLIESGFTISYDNKSLELIHGINKFGYTIQSDVNFSNRVAAGSYQHEYIRTIPTAVAVATVAVGAYYVGTAAVATGTAIVTAVEKLIEWGTAVFE